MKSIAVVGGGITGVTTAYALIKQGFSVTLFEQNRYAAMETSFANGGQLSASNAEVWNHWSTVLKGLKWMLKNDAPLLVNPKPSWHKLSWFAEFLANIPRYADNTTATARLAIAARSHFFQWAADEGLDFNVERRGILHIYRNRKDFDHAGRVSKLLAAGGLERHPVTPEEMRSLEPSLKGKYYGGYYTESDATGDIHRFTVGLAAAAQRLGAEIRYSQMVEHLQSDGKQAHVMARTPEGITTSTFDAVVVCAGVHSRSLGAQLGDRLNVYPVKGYSITVNLLDEQSQQSAPWVSLLDDETKLVTSRLGVDRLGTDGSPESAAAPRPVCSGSVPSTAGRAMPRRRTPGSPAPHCADHRASTRSAAGSPSRSGCECARRLAARNTAHLDPAESASRQHRNQTS